MAFLPVLDAITPIVNKVLDLIPDPVQRANAEKQLMDGLQAWDAQQAAVNVEEAKSESMFVAGWRPCIGWVCACIFGYNFLIQPFLIFLLITMGSTFDPEKLPMLDYTSMMPVMMGMLGLAGARTFEKIKGVA